MTAKNAAIRRYILLSVIVFLSNNYAGLAQLTANFSATPLSGCSPLIVSFTDQSTGSPTQWHWDLGNSTISTVQNPSTTYFTLALTQ
ncbi:MAG: hypothetical protein IPP48_07255 [Chitinophagaceae bacterium]|nr:hypothetical protein [Chitinophagaceae bacterium]